MRQISEAKHSARLTPNVSSNGVSVLFTISASSKCPPNLYAMPAFRSLSGNRLDAAAELVAALVKPEVSKLV